jgi:DNA processing protein
LIYSEDTRISLSDEERTDWLRLIRTENIGPRLFQSLLRRFGTARAALEALPELGRRGGATQLARIHPRADAARELEAAAQRGITYLALCEPHYPLRLQAIADPPPLVAIRGKIEALSAPTIAIVGSRNASAAGIKFASRVARDLAAAGFVVVSGLARGIDAAAHRASVSSGTVAVLAGGHACIYPPEHIELLEAIVANGAAISERPLDWEPRAHDFPRRNRLISGLAAGVLVVEAAKRSGSLITARLALEQGREVFAVPGSPLDQRAEGTNGLLKQGAALVTEAADIISVLEPIIGRPMDRRPPEPEDPAQQLDSSGSRSERARIVDLLGPIPIPLDDLIRLSGSPAALVHMTLLELEVAGRVARRDGGIVALL